MECPWMWFNKITIEKLTTTKPKAFTAKKFKHGFGLVASIACTTRKRCPPQPTELWLAVLNDYGMTGAPLLHHKHDVYRRAVILESLCMMVEWTLLEL